MKALLQESIERTASRLGVGLDLPQRHQLSWLQAQLAIKLGASLDEVHSLSNRIAEHVAAHQHLSMQPVLSTSTT